jgi:hypothetical protein
MIRLESAIRPHLTGASAAGDAAARSSASADDDQTISPLEGAEASDL